jgi:hypothetical protein
MPGSSAIERSGDAGVRGARQTLGEPRAHLARDVVVARLALHVGRRAAHVHEHDPAPGASHDPGHVGGHRAR